MLIPIEEDLWDSIPQAGELINLLKGDKIVVKANYADKI